MSLGAGVTRFASLRAGLRQSGAFRSRRFRGPRMARFRLAGPGFRATTWGAGDYM